MLGRKKEMKRRLKRNIYIYIFFFFLAGGGGLPWLLRQSNVCLQCGRPGFDPWVGKIPWRRKWQPTPVLWKTPWTEEPGSYSPWGRKESDTTELLHFWLLIWFIKDQQIECLVGAWPGHYSWSEEKSQEVKPRLCAQTP